MLTNAAVLLALAAPAPVAAPPVAAPIVEPPAAAVIDVLHSSGTGCPEKQDSTQTLPSPDRHAVTLVYSLYGVFVGPDPVTEQRSPASRSCVLVVKVTPPAGYTSAVDHIDQRGFADLPARATGQVLVTYHSANSSPVTAHERLRSPSDDGWQTAHRVPAHRQVFGPCGQPHFVLVNTELLVTAPDGVRANASVYSTDVSTNNLTWRRC